jgi:tRNA threonylcarbamoyl adenosine modification protein (Sua5/YciO/YrdC/YwlC family)
VSEARIVRTDSPGWLSDAVGILQRGGLVVFPTDTVYGVGAVAFDPAAVARIYRAKGRREENPIPVLVDGEEAMDKLSLHPPAGARRLAHAFWPGPLTLVVPKAPGLPAEVGPGPSVGLRAPDHPVAMRLLRAIGPLATSSANPSGKPPTTHAEDVRASLGGTVDLVIDGGEAPGGMPSTVLDCTCDPPQVLRPGPVSLEEILAVWAG